MNFEKIILTPSERLARQLSLYGQASVYTVNYFFEQFFLACNSSVSLLNDTKAIFLWQSIIRDKSPQLLFNRDTARLAYEADTLLTESYLTPNDLPPFLSENVTTFLVWKKRFDEVCEENNYLPMARLPDYLRLHSALGPWIPACAGMTEQGKEIRLQGFEVMPKNQALFWEFMVSKGVKVVYEHPSPFAFSEDLSHKGRGDNTKEVYAFETLEDEIIGVAQYAFEQYQKNPDRRLLIIVPHLFEMRETLQSIFYNTFFGADYLVPHFEQKILSISGGTALTKTPLIQAVFHVLALLNDEAIDVENFCYYLQSNYFHEENTLEVRLALIQNLYKVGMKKIKDADIISSSIMFRGNDEAKLSQLLSTFLSARKNTTAWVESTFEQGVVHINSLLAQLSFLSQYQLLSHETQIFKSWQECMKLLPTLDTQKHAKESILETLAHLASQSLFQEKNGEAPIQILRLLEAAGIEANEIILMNMDSDTFPQPASPNPFLPLSFQIDHQLPHSSEAEETRFAKKLLQRFFSSADKIIFTYAKQRDNKPMAHSPLLPVIPAQAGIHRTLQSFMDPRLRGGDEAALETLEDLHGIPLEKNSVAKGGTAILKDMLNCPFQAYGHFRLKARTREGLSDNYTAKERGSILHRALEILFDTPPLTRGVIGEADGGDLKFVQNALEKAMHSIPKRLPAVLKSLEKKRMLKLIEDFLSHENLRGNFAIHALESKQNYTLGDLQFELRLDRLERWHSGELVVIDYKTGQVDSKFLDKELEPQLPLYALTDNEITGVFLLQIHPKGIIMTGMVCAGVTDNKNIQYCTHDEWADFKARWKALLEKAATEYRLGYAAISPKSCDYCDLAGLCRINSLNLDSAD